MYEAFYEFTQTPFTRGIASNSLFMTDDREEILIRLTFTAQRQLFAVLTGDCGTGKTTLLRKFKDTLDDTHYRVLYISDCICDECHLMSREMLEEIRFLLNVKLDSVSPMGLILAGQSELWDKLNRQAFTAIRQRIDVQSKLNHYDRAQNDAYIRKQLNVAGCKREIFTNAAMEEIFRFSSGSARLINKVCTASLLYGSQSKLKLLDDRAIKLIIDCELS